MDKRLKDKKDLEIQLNIFHEHADADKAEFYDR